ncbi:hypothetical protein FLX56_28745 [Synechococcus moorigangaii CMS01]|nr:hypothetical protein [Synechococcus moorigangaii CMS01]
MCIRDSVDTKIKHSTADSTELSDSEIHSLSINETIEVNWYRPAANEHWEFELDSPINGKFNWFAYEPHIRIEDPDIQDGENILDAVTKVNANQLYYQPKHIGGSPALETFCNWFVADVLDVLGVPIPRYNATAGSYIKPHPIYGNKTPMKPKAAEHLFKELANTSGWSTVTKAQAVSNAKRGKPTVVCAPASAPGRNGHIAIVLPKGSVSDVRIAQAGAFNSNDTSFEKGFGSKTSTAKFFVYE